jgi:TonB-dependent SusC/RagA subfamily outer membrane receptor
MKINIFQSSVEDKGTVVKMLQTITNSDEIIIEYSRHSGLRLSSENIISAIYLLITIAFLSIFFLALYKIFRLKKKYPGTKMNGISFISTDAKGTPFSFFNSIFWNNAIDIYSRQGQQIFNHEIAHVKEKHSYDKIFMNALLIFFWMNPFFWLMRKELSMIHEFIADKEALEDSDINAFAEMILQTVYPGQQFSITNNFFHSPLKRRLIMFTKNKNPKVSYLSRLLVLPLAAIVFFAFTLKMKTIIPANLYNGKKITVVIDAGHGGSDNGAVENNINEKDLNLSIAKDIKELNKNENLNIILSRSGDELLTPKDRVKFALENKADLFVSIHINAEDNKNEHNGIEIFIPKNDNTYLNQSKLLGSSLIDAFKNNYELQVPNDLKQSDHGIWVLNASQYPAVLIEPGFLTTQKDLEYLVNPKNQQTIAENILKGIEKYAEQNLVANINSSNSIEDTVPASSLTKKSDLPPNILYVVDNKPVSKEEAMSINPRDIESINVLKDESAVKQYGEKGKNGVIVIKKKTKAVSSSIIENTGKPDPIYFLDGKEISKDKMNTLSPNAIQSISVLKGESAIAVYGQKAKNGVILIKSKPEGLNTTSVTIGTNTNTSANSIHLTNQNDKSSKMNNNTEFNGHPNINNTTDTIPDKIFTKVENEAEFPGGKEAWTKYIVSKVKASVDSLNDKDFGTCVVKFIVNTDGSVSEVEATTMKDTKLAEVAMNAIRTGPKWIPATQNDHVVASYRLQPVTLSNPEKK